MQKSSFYQHKYSNASITISRTNVFRVFALACILVSLMLFVLVFNSGVSKAELKFHSYASSYDAHLRNTLLINETLLENFSAFLGVVGYEDKEVAKAYVDSIVKSFSKVYIIEAVHRIPRDLIGEVARIQSSIGNSSYELKAFNFDDNQRFHEVEVKPFYSPIVFMEPADEEQRNILGLDVESIDFLKTAMERSQKVDGIVSTPPFELIEGDFGYVMFNPVGRVAVSNVGEGMMFSLLVIRAKELMPAHMFKEVGTQVVLYHPDFPRQDTDGHLVEILGDSRSNIENILFPNLRYEKVIGGEEQRLILLIEQQLGWDTFNLPLLITIGVFSALLTLVVVRYRNIYNESDEQRRKAEYAIFVMANFDPLTQLPNRPHLLNQLFHSLADAEEAKSGLCVAYIKLKDYERIELRSGCGISDAFLVSSSNRLRKFVSENDFVAKLDGGEFVMVSDCGGADKDVDELKKLLDERLKGVMVIGGEKLSLDADIGISLYPRDGSDPKQLIRAARDQL